MDEHNYDLRVLNTIKWDHQQAYEEILEIERMIQEELVPNLKQFEKFKEMLEQGFLYGHARDSKMRPVVILNLRKLVDAGLEVQDFIELNDFYMSYIVQNALVPGRIEQFNLIVDARDVSLSEIPLKCIVTINKHAITLMKHRSCQTLVVGVSWYGRMALKFINNFMDSFQIAKVKFFGNDFTADFE